MMSNVIDFMTGVRKSFEIKWYP